MLLDPPDDETYKLCVKEEVILDPGESDVLLAGKAGQIYVVLEVLEAFKETEVVPMIVVNWFMSIGLKASFAMVSFELGVCNRRITSLL
jgi:hypothetical protein